MTEKGLFTAMDLPSQIMKMMLKPDTWATICFTSQCMIIYTKEDMQEIFLAHQCVVV